MKGYDNDTHNEDEHNEGKDNDNDDDTYEIPNVNISNQIGTIRAI